MVKDVSFVVHYYITSSDLSKKNDHGVYIIVPDSESNFDIIHILDNDKKLSIISLI